METPVDKRRILLVRRHSGPRAGIQSKKEAIPRNWMPPYQSTGQAPRVRHDDDESSFVKTKVFIGVALVLILMAVTLRLAPHPPNFAPIAAVAIFGGALLPRRLGLIVPLAAIIITDLIIGTHDLMLVTWGSYALIALASSLWLRQKLSFMRGAATTLGASLFFFITTNFAVWLTSGMYERTWAGLVQCFTLALPFFRNTLFSDLIYTAVLFGAYALAVKTSIYFAQSRQTQTNKLKL